MNDILDQLSDYGAHFDYAIERGTHAKSTAEPSSDPAWTARTYEGDLIMLDQLSPDADTDSSGRTPRSASRYTVAGAAAAVVLVVVGGLFLINRGSEDSTDDATSAPAGSAPTPSSADSGPETVIEGYVEAYNTGNIDSVMALFNEDSVIIDHPFAPRAAGLSEIREVQVDDLANAAAKDPYVISNVEVEGDTVTWDHRWTNADGQDWCAAGQSAVVSDGAIVSWAWPTAAPCSVRSGYIASYTAAYNSRDIDRVMALFTEDTVIIGHPFAASAEGLDDIRRLQERDRSQAADIDPYLVSNVEVVGDTVTWDHQWTNAQGDQWCATGQSAVVDDGAIVSWTWPGAVPCSVSGAIIERYVDSYNAGEVDAVMESFTEDSVIVGHPSRSLVEGLTAIRALTVADFEAAADVDPYSMTNLNVIGSTATWDQRWTREDDQMWCAAGHSAVIEDGKIIAWTWPTSVVTCD